MKLRRDVSGCGVEDKGNNTGVIGRMSQNVPNWEQSDHLLGDDQPEVWLLIHISGSQKDDS